MKKIFTLMAVAMLCTLPMAAQEIVFVDANGAPLADGAALTASTVETDDFGVSQVGSGLSVRNTTDGDLGVAIRYTVDGIDNGIFNICFPVQCYGHEVTGSFATPAGTLAAGETKSLVSEWVPNAAGTASVTYQIETFSISGPAFNPTYTSTGLGAKVSVNFTYNGTAGVGRLMAEDGSHATEYYDLAGRRLSQPCHGINVVRQSNGRLMKQVVR